MSNVIKLNGYDVKDFSGVHYNAADGKTVAEKLQARQNIGASSTEIESVVSEATLRLHAGEYVIPHAWINSSGVVTAVAAASIGGAADYDLVVYQVYPGDIIEEITTDPAIIIFAYYVDAPAVGSTSYNGARRASSYTTLTNETVPAGVGWIAIRKPSGGSITFDNATYLDKRIAEVETRAEQTIKKYATVADLIADRFALQVGEIVETLGYYSISDGGGTMYRIITDTPAWHAVTLGGSPTKYAEQIRHETPVNALSVGIHGDGTNPDGNNSNLFQRATNISDVYFPAGTYLFDSTLLPRHNVLGAAYERSYGPTTVFKSAVSSGYVIKLDSSALNIIIANIGIVIEADGVGGIQYRNTAYTNHVLQGVNISGIGSSGIGISIDPTISISRYVYADHLSIRGKGNGYTSTGIYITSGGADIKLSNIEVMACQIGVYAVGGILYGDNWHIWTSATDATSAWWADTVALQIDQYVRFMGANIYLDSAHNFIKGTGEGFADIANLMILSDNHVFNLSGGYIANGCKLFAHGGVIYQGDTFAYLFDNVTLSDVMFLTDNAFSDIYPHAPVIGQEKTSGYVVSLTGEPFEDIAEFVAGSGAYGKICLMLDDDVCELTVSGGTLTKTDIVGQPAVYYVKAGDLVHIAIAGDYEVAQVEYTLHNSGVRALNYGLTRQRLGGEYERTTYDSAATLTEIE